VPLRRRMMAVRLDFKLGLVGLQLTQPHVWLTVNYA